MKYAYLLLLAMLTMASCSSKEEILEIPNEEDSTQESVGYSFSLNVGESQTRLIYHDNIGPEHSAYNPNADGTNQLTMAWENGDTLVAIRWSRDFDEYVVLKAIVEGDDDEKTITTFASEGTVEFKHPLTEGERFVLVHGDFVLDASDKSDPKLDFPTSQVTKAGYASHIHHGGVEDGNGGLTFRNQDGTLENLHKHEYMVADCYVHLGDIDANGIQQVSFRDKEDKDIVKMNVAHTLLRLTLFLPDEHFKKGDAYDDLISVSIKDVKLNNIFHRYFRMHPNTPNDTTYYKTSYNDNADKEANPYIRINLVDETTKEPGVRLGVENKLGEGFEPKKPVCVISTLKGEPGLYLTLYFSLPSRHMGLGKDVSDLAVTAFTRSSAYTTTNAYTSEHPYHLPDAAMQPGMVVPLNVSFLNNTTPIKAITDPELGISFTPGFVWARKDGDDWVYGVYKNQGEYAGMGKQTLDFGEYFTFGSTDPTQAYHMVGSTGIAAVVPSTFVDVAAEVEVGEVKGFYHMLTKAEADRVMARLKTEIDKNGVFLGYYYYDDKDGNTKHKAPGSQNPTILSAAASGSKTQDELKAMSATVGIYVGRSTQPIYEEQDDYFFLPNAKQMNNIASTSMAKVETCKDGSGNPVYYYIPKDYTDLDATGDDSKLTSAFSTIFKFSTWLRTEGTSSGQGYRMQAWTDKTGTAIDWNSTNVTSFDGKFARPIRAVIY